jgi:hypothetical protein
VLQILPLESHNTSPSEHLSQPDWKSTVPHDGEQDEQRPDRLKCSVTWAYTDRRHYPPSPGTGHTLIEPIPYPYVYVPSPITRIFMAPPMNRANTTTSNDQVNSTYDSDRAEVIASEREARKEADNGNGYPITSSPTVKKLTRLTQNNNTGHEIQHQIERLELDASSATSFALSKKHLERKFAIVSSRSIAPIKTPAPLFRSEESNNKLNMHQLWSLTGEDAEKKKRVAEILHARERARTKGMEDPFAAKPFNQAIKEPVTLTTDSEEQTLRNSDRNPVRRRLFLT